MRHLTGPLMLCTLHGLLTCSDTGYYGCMATENLEELLRENLRLAQENNSLLRKMRRASLLGFWFKVLFYLVIIGLPIFLYRFYVAEYLHDLQATYEQIRLETDRLNGFTSDDIVPEKLKQYFENTPDQSTSTVRNRAVE